MRASIQFGSKQMDFQLEYSKRKSLGITVTPESDILVRAPVETTLEKIKEKVKRKAPWIIKQQNFFLSFQPKTSQKKFISGETHLYLGRQYRLKVFSSNKNSIHFNGKEIQVYHKKNTSVKNVLIQWYRERAKIKFTEIAAPLIKRFERYKVQPKEMYILEMSTRWGSCTAKGKIILNPELIKSPKGCIEYVIIHELCHLVHLGHTQKFVDLQTKEFPDWQKWKFKLECLLA